MPPKKHARASSSAAAEETPRKSRKVKKEDTPTENGTTNTSESKKKKKNKQEDEEEEHDFILREYYPPEISDQRVAEYMDGTRQKPLEALEAALESTKNERSKIRPGDAVVHWFRTDLRVNDNTALYKASELAKKEGKPVLGLYVWSHQDLEAHCRSPARVDFYRRTLEVLRKDLAKLDIPLFVLEVDVRKQVETKVLDLCEEWGACCLFGNLEYEVDELRRDTKVIKEGLKRKIAAEFLHDDCVIKPGLVVAKSSGKPYAVFTPFLRSWLAIAYDPDKWKLSPTPSKNPASARKKYSKLFEDQDLPVAKGPQAFEDDKERKRLAKLWPAGEDEALRRLKKFIANGVKEYKVNRDMPSESTGTSKLSVHLSAGTISARQVTEAAAKVNHRGKVDGGDLGPNTYISEIAWRDFYRHIICFWPYISMNKPWKVDYSHVRWNYNEDHFKAWTTGHTGFPIVDAAMRQLNSMKWMHNRCRMIVASFLTKDLLLDWRKGERYFMEQLIDGDLASNNGGWQWSAGCGVDPQPYFRIFNPLRQSERFDEDGDYIRQWVPELKGLDNKAIHDPYGRLDKKEFEKLGYPKPIVDHSKARDTALARYKEGLSKG